MFVRLNRRVIRDDAHRPSRVSKNRKLSQGPKDENPEELGENRDVKTADKWAKKNDK
jgi:hypothetical protein